MFKYITALLPLLFTACVTPSAPQSEGENGANTMAIAANATTLQSIDGDFDGDGTKERATLYHVPEQQSSDSDSIGTKCEDERYIVAFDNNEIPPYISKQRLSHMTLIGDINGDGRDEYGAFSRKDNSSWGSYSAYCNRGEEWQKIASTTLNIDLLERIDSDIDISKLITADTTQRGYIQVQRIVIIDGAKAQISTEKIELN